MFDLSEKIEEWRRRLAAGQVAGPEGLDELESHLREDVEEQVRAGLSAEKAFELAVQRIGRPTDLKGEFEKIGETPDAVAWGRRIIRVERDIMLPVKAAVILLLIYSLYTSSWFLSVSTVEDVAIQLVQRVVWFYVALNLLMTGVLVASRRLPCGWLHTAVFTMSIVDGLFLSLLCFVTGGYCSVAYWLFLGLIVRSSASMLRTAAQAILNLSVIACYALAAILDIWFASYSLSPNELKVLELYANPDATEQVLLRVMLLLVVAVCCFLMQTILGRQRLRAAVMETGQHR